jgi:hypothetical protein
VGIGREDQGAEAGERPEGRRAWCALILVDLDVPADASHADTVAVVERWAQMVRHAHIDEGTATNDARAVVLPMTSQQVVAALKLASTVL